MLMAGDNDTAPLGTWSCVSVRVALWRYERRLRVGSSGGRFDALSELSAEAGLALVRGLGYKIPVEVEDAAAVLVEFAKIFTGPLPSVGPVPTDAKKVGAYLRAEASAAAEREALQKTTTDLGGPPLAFVGEYRDAPQGWIEHLRSDFDESLAEFTEAIAVAPELHASSNDDQVAAFTTALRSAEFLKHYLRVRVQLGTSVGEAGAAPGIVYVVAALPQPPADPAAFNQVWPEVHAAVAASSSIREGGVHPWRQLLGGGQRVNLAPYGGIEQRIGQQQHWQMLANNLNLGGGNFHRDVVRWAEVG